jgi:DNA-binding response OmpR family regulator
MKLVNEMALVIDDELDICLMVTKHLQSLHFKTQYALTVEDAYLKIDRSDFALMFIDLTLPDGSGFDIINYVSAVKQTPKIIVISAQDNQAAYALSIGVSLFISKPFTIKTINEALKNLNLLSL